MISPADTSPEAITALSALIGAIGGILGTWFLARKAAREDTHRLVDQLQEERSEFVQQLDKERLIARENRVAYEEKIDAFWRDKYASRRHVAALEDHIWQRREPPPPHPPEGYIR